MKKEKETGVKINIPKEVEKVIRIMQKNQAEAYIVGGCVRDSLMGKKPEDWDIATNFVPEKIQEIFDKEGFKTFYENDFGTVGVVLPSNKERDFDAVVEITTYRKESAYTKRRRPERVDWAETIEEDLSRRDFTVNAVAIRPADSKKKIDECQIVDPFKGKEDLKKKTIRAVGEPLERFSEDALRMMRAVRFATTLSFKIEKETEKAIVEGSKWLKEISQERIRDEFVKIIMDTRAAQGVESLREMKLLRYIVPELEDGYGVEQSKHHIYDCYKHNLLSLDYAAKKDFSKEVRLAALLHDIAKPKTKRGKGKDATFHGHEVVGARMAQKILERLKFSKEETKKIVKLIRYHLFYYNVGEVSESSVRRLVRQVGKDSIDELLQLRSCDRIGSGVPKAEPYKLRHLRYLIDKTSQDAISVGMLEIKGDDIMKILDIPPSKKVGWILEALLGIVLDNPSENSLSNLKKRAKEIASLPDEKISRLAQKSKDNVGELEAKKEKEIKKRYWVK